jgi:hypothetical protein
MADLDRWFTEDYVVPGEAVPGEDVDKAPPEENGRNA